MNTLRWLAWKLFRWPTVVLDAGCYGPNKFRLLRWRRYGRWWAPYYGFNIRDVFILDGGEIGNGIYVTSWRWAWWCDPSHPARPPMPKLAVKPPLPKLKAVPK